MPDEEQIAPVMTVEEQETYRTELRNELAELEMSQAFFYSKYKQDRINRLKGRLGIPVD